MAIVAAEYLRQYGTQRHHDHSSKFIRPNELVNMIEKTPGRPNDRSAL
jgi:2-polyprenyl-3-methyl-5-hydroxy-6-metoxy-1,4-benzoquinol methylase